VPGGRSFTELEVDEVVATTSIGLSAKLYDDDDQYLADDSPLYPSILGLPSPPLPALDYAGPCLITNQWKFASAYITLVNANTQGWNTTQTNPFKRHADVGLTSSPFDAGNQQLKGKDRPEFWAHTVVFGYQGLPKEDGEPNEEATLLGATRKSLGGLFHCFSAIYVETIRDNEFGQIPPGVFQAANEREGLRNRYLEQLYVTIAHEIGHAPDNQSESTDHAELGVMTKGTVGAARQGFTPRTIQRFRSTERWTR
jgi:hypothetical protein